MKQPEALASLVGILGVTVIIIHDYAYRRADAGRGEGDYEFGGLITHAGADMVILSLVLAAGVWAWSKWGPL